MADGAPSRGSLRLVGELTWLGWLACLMRLLVFYLNLVISRKTNCLISVERREVLISIAEYRHSRH